jgi:titin
MPTVNSDIFLSNSNITSIKLGNTSVSKVFLGEDLVFGSVSCPDSTSSVKMTGWVYGDRILSPIGYAPYGRETYTYGDEVVRYETGVWLYTNTGSEIVRVYSYAERPWLVDWPAPYVAQKVLQNGTICAATVPDAPGFALTGYATVGDAQVTLQWLAPSSNGGAPITDYVVQFSSDSGATWTTFTDDVSVETTATITGLTNGTEYIFRVAAVNIVGTGPYTTAPTTTTIIPAPVLYFTAAADNQASNLSNWFRNAAGTIPAVALPTSNDDVVFLQDADNLDGAQDFQCRNLSITSKWLTNFAEYRIFASGTATLSDAFLLDVTLSAAVIVATNNSGADGSDYGTALNAPSITLTDFVDSGAVFINSSNLQLFGSGQQFLSIAGTATFNGSTTLGGTVYGNATFNDDSANISLGYWDYDTWIYGVEGNATFNDNSSNRGQVSGNATFNDASVNAFVVFDPVEYFAGVRGNATFNDSSKACGIVEGTTTRNTTGVCAVPGAPTGLSATAIQDAVQLDWTAPSGGASITGYLAQYSSDGGTSWTVFSDWDEGETMEVYGLSGGTSYLFRVAAISVEGVGPYSGTASAVTFTEEGTLLRTEQDADCYEYEVFADGGGGEYREQGNFYCNAPSQLPAPTLTRENLDVDYPGFNETADTIAVSWQQGNNVTEYYRVEGSTNDFVTSVFYGDDEEGVAFGLSIEIGAPDPGIYKFRVYAVNQAGSSPASAPSAPVIFAFTPSSPRSLSGTAENEQVSLSWTVPSNTGGVPITDYIVEYSSNDGTTWTTFADGSSAATSVTVTGLTNGTSYLFRVAATNGARTSDYTTTGSITPVAPTTFNYVYKLFNLTYISNIAYSIYGLDYDSSGDDGETLPPASLSASPGTGWSGSGTPASKLSASGAVTVANFFTTAVTLTANSAGLLRITGDWSSYADGGSYINFDFSTGGDIVQIENGPVDLTRTVSAGTTVAFIFEHPYSSLTNVQAWIIPPAAPPAPTSLASPSQGSGSVYLTWAAPANDGGSAITDYVVQYSSNSGSTWNTFSDGTSTALNATVTGLTNGTSYQFRVAAVNAIGTGSYSSTTTATPTAGNSFLGATSGSGTVSDPYILNNVTVSATASVTIQWQQVATGRYNCDYGDHVTLERRNSSNALISANDRRDGAAQISNPVTLNTGDKLVTYNDCADGYYRVWFV